MCCILQCQLSCYWVAHCTPLHQSQMIIATFYLLLSALKVGFWWILCRLKVGYYRKRRSPLGRFFWIFCKLTPVCTLVDPNDLGVMNIEMDSEDLNMLTRFHPLNETSRLAQANGWKKRQLPSNWQRCQQHIRQQPRTWVGRRKLHQVDQELLQY